MKALVDGVKKFQQTAFPAHQDLFSELASGQSPEWLFVTCADSRIDPCLITQTKPGELFLCRNAGNIVPPFGEAMGGVSATIEYAVMALGVRHIIVCGHSDCGAMKGVLHPDKVAHLKSRSWTT
jgi:carbonic anhydrase